MGFRGSKGHIGLQAAGKLWPTVQVSAEVQVAFQQADALFWAWQPGDSGWEGQPEQRDGDDGGGTACCAEGPE